MHCHRICLSRAVRMNIRVFILVALFVAVLLQAGTADAIIVKNASSIWNTTSENIPENITASPRIITEYSNSIFSSTLEDTPENITALPRIIVEYSNSVFSSDLDTPEDITTSPRIIAEYSNSIWSTNFAFPKELINDTTPPIITNVTRTNITDDSATIKWDTGEFANSLVKYGKTSGIYTGSKEDPLFVKNHTIELTGLLPGTCYYFVVNSTDQSGNSNESIEYDFNTTGELKVFDTGAPANPYPSIMGNHTGTIKPNRTVIATKLYTYPCSGTGGHTEYAEIKNATWNATATWEGYAGDWHNITFDKTVVLLANEPYNYTIRTGSYPQIIHEQNYTTLDGSFINCTQFTDANGKEYNDWIPAIKFFW